MIGGIRKAVEFTAVVFAVFLITRAMIYALPGDPVSTLLAETGLNLPADVLRKELGLDRPFLQSAVFDFFQALHGDFGASLVTRQPIGPVLAGRFWQTLQLTLLSVTVGMLVSLCVGIAAASDAPSKLQRLADRWCTLHGALASALPTPWLGPILIWIFAVQLRIFPIGGSILLPGLTLALVFAGLWARLVRERVRETLRFGSARGARARGLPEWKVLIKYGFAPASGSLIAYLGTQVGAFLSTGFVTEVVFGFNGMGTLLVDSVLSRDYPSVQAGVLVAALCALAGTWIGDWAHARIDTRLIERSDAA